MATFISSRRQVKVESYSHSFHYVSDPGAGYGIDCDKDGTLTYTRTISREYLDNLWAKLMTGTIDGRKVLYDGIVDYSHYYTEPAMISCDSCGNEVLLEFSLTNTCDNCGADYNMSGQRLASREFWGEETGESYADIQQGNERMY